MTSWSIERVAIIDDDQHEANVMSVLVEDAGFKPKILENRFDSPRELAEAIRNEAQAAVCDHRLRHHDYARFDGAALVAQLYELRIPSLLVTQFINIDADVSIRRWRHRVPALLRRDEADSERIRQGLMVCFQELAGNPPPDRKPWRTMVRVEGIGRESGEDVIDAIVPSWNPREAVRFPCSLLPTQLRGDVQEGFRLLARVNIGAKDATDLFLYDFERAPEPDSDNGLG